MAIPNINEIMEQAKKMQERMLEAQKKLTAMEVAGEAVGGMVKVVMNGRHEVKSIYIDPNIMKDGAVIVADLVRVAVNNAVAKVEDVLKSEMMHLSKEFNIPSQGAITDGGTGGETGGMV